MQEITSFGSTNKVGSKSKKKTPPTSIHVLGPKVSNDKALSILKDTIWEWQKSEIKEKKSFTQVSISSKSGPSVIVRPKSPGKEHFEKSLYAQTRDLVGGAFSKNRDCDRLEISLHETEGEVERGALVGIELAQYRYSKISKKENKLPALEIKKGSKSIDSKLQKEAIAVGRAVNAARHLVNTPAGDLNPSSYEKIIRKAFGSSERVKITTWKDEKLKKDGFNLVYSVGKGAEEDPRIVKVSYRPKAASKSKPVAFVGKGITFDTGGLNLKPASGMRLMKKDMGGSAVLFGLCQYLIETQHTRACDFYFALAENSVSKKSYRPGDILHARNGLRIEIGNTDAEGRLVLADALMLAEDEKPEAIVDVATLTGAAKIALGAELITFFSSDDRLASDIEKASQRSGDPLWRLPLYEPYRRHLDCAPADLCNISSVPFAGAIMAALFLKEFVEKTPWAHLDIYAWQDGSRGAITETGASGQAVQCLIEWLRGRT